MNKFNWLLGVGLLLLASLATARCEAAWKAPAAAAETRPPFPAEAEAISNGRALYGDRCADCHGKTGKGNGPGASDLEKAPTIFRDG